MEVKFQIRLEKPNAGVDFGIQQGSGSTYLTLQKQRSTGEDLVFDFVLNLKSQTGVFPIFVGAVAQGSPQERFVYIDIGTAAGQIGSIWSRRLKVPLKSVTWEMLRQVQTDSQAVLAIKVPGIGKDGGPTCSSVKGGEGWKIKA
ncbi:hypothetical protein DR864_27105 [Runella rosea]|uniref:Uncharacterized protein n=1 Tax=Runella rosea TaxID=2259595 RepID=A0A344TR72_9BACT|nr:DUF5990 family protein [Runella rosea]AXE21143.1 hypothetical protein DR864_27105 [Runella rosea]